MQLRWVVFFLFLMPDDFCLAISVVVWFAICSRLKSKRGLLTDEAPPVAAAMGGVFLFFVLDDFCFTISVVV